MAAPRLAAHRAKRQSRSDSKPLLTSTAAPSNGKRLALARLSTSPSSVTLFEGSERWKMEVSPPASSTLPSPSMTIGALAAPKSCGQRLESLTLYVACASRLMCTVAPAAAP